MTRRHTPLAVALLLVACAATSAATSASSQASADSSAVRVWVNPRSGVYHCPGTPPYGTTARGFYVSEADAKARRYRPAGGRVCGPNASRESGAIQALAGVPTVRPESLLTVLNDSTAPRRPQRALDSCTVTKIVDGDTFECREQGKIRPIGFDTPERGEAYFAAATAALSSLIPVGTVVQLEYDVDSRDRYDRVLAYVWSGRLMVNWAMVRQGWARVYRGGRTVRYRSAFEDAERRARAEGRGLWPLGGLGYRPNDRRAKRC